MQRFRVIALSAGRLLGDRVVVVLNGDTTGDPRVTDRLRSGVFALQILGEGEIRYRNVRIRTR